MATELRLRRGTTDEHGNFIGAEAEATVDTDKNTIVVHDGQTQGGFPLAQESDTAPAVDSVASLRNSVFPENVERIWLSGYYEVGTAGGGPLYRDSADTTTADNGGTVFVDADGKRWKRPDMGYVTIEEFGAANSVADNSPSIQAALDTGKKVLAGSDTFTCASALVVKTRGQIFQGAGKGFAGGTTILDFSGQEANGIEVGDGSNRADEAQIKDLYLKGVASADTDRNAGIKIVQCSRGVVEDVRVTDFAIGISWENSTRGWVNTIRDCYFFNNRVCGAYLWGGNHATAFFGGELAGGKYGAVIGRLQSDGSIDDDFSGNTGGWPSLQGTVIEGMSDYGIVIANGQLGVNYNGYMESSTALSAFVRIGSQFKNDGVTPATGIAKGVFLKGHFATNGSIASFPALKIGAVVGGAFEGMVSGNTITGIDTTECRFSSNFETAGLWVSTGDYLSGASNNTVSSDVYPSNRGGAYARRYMTYSVSSESFQPSLILPSLFQDGIVSNRDSDGKVIQFQSDGTEVGSINSEFGRLNLVSKGPQSKWSNDSLGVSLTDTGSTLNFKPLTDANVRCGSGASRWSEVFAVNGTINTSDSREKQEERNLTDAEQRIAKELKNRIRMFRWSEAVERKGESGARWHCGVIAQEVAEVFASEGLDASDYGMFCYDEWDSGDRYGVRYEELMAFIISSL